MYSQPTIQEKPIENEIKEVLGSGEKMNEKIKEIVAKVPPNIQKKVDVEGLTSQLQKKVAEES